MRISDWSSDVCSSDLDLAVLQADAEVALRTRDAADVALRVDAPDHLHHGAQHEGDAERGDHGEDGAAPAQVLVEQPVHAHRDAGCGRHRSEEHTSELQSLMRISYAVFCLKKTNKSVITH